MPLSRSSSVTSTTLRAKSGVPSERMQALTTTTGCLGCVLGRTLDCFSCEPGMTLVLLFGELLFEMGEFALRFFDRVESAAKPGHPACQHSTFLLQVVAYLLD